MAWTKAAASWAHSGPSRVVRMSGVLGMAAVSSPAACRDGRPASRWPGRGKHCCDRLHSCRLIRSQLNTDCVAVMRLERLHFSSSLRLGQRAE
jgi:hypothetical protein